MTHKWTLGGQSWHRATNAPARRACGRVVSSARDCSPRRPLRGWIWPQASVVRTRVTGEERVQAPPAGSGVSHDVRVRASQCDGGSRPKVRDALSLAMWHLPAFQAASPVDLQSLRPRHRGRPIGDGLAGTRRGNEHGRTPGRLTAIRRRVFHPKDARERSQGHFVKSTLFAKLVWRNHIDLRA